MTVINWTLNEPSRRWEARDSNKELRGVIGQHNNQWEAYANRLLASGWAKSTDHAKACILAIIELETQFER